jgi:hypothetical protein
MAVKFLAAPMALGAIAAVAAAPPAGSGRRVRLRAVGAAVAGAAAAMLAVAAATALLSSGPGVWHDSVLFHLHARDQLPARGDAPLTDGGDPAAAAYVALGVALAILIGLAAARGDLGRDRMRSLAGPLVALVGGAAFVALLRPLFPHHFVAVTVPGALLAAALWPAGERRPSRWWVALAAVGLAALVGAAGGLRDTVAGDQEARERAVADAVRSLAPAGQAIVTDAPRIAVRADRPVPARLVDLSRARTRSGDVTPDEVVEDARRGGAVLVVAGRSFAVVPGFAQTFDASFGPPVELPHGVRAWRVR